MLNVILMSIFILHVKCNIVKVNFILILNFQTNFILILHVKYNFNVNINITFNMLYYMVISYTDSAQNILTNIFTYVYILGKSI